MCCLIIYPTVSSHQVQTFPVSNLLKSSIQNLRIAKRVEKHYKTKSLPLVAKAFLIVSSIFDGLIVNASMPSLPMPSPCSCHSLLPSIPWAPHHHESRRRRCGDHHSGPADGCRNWHRSLRRVAAAALAHVAQPHAAACWNFLRRCQ